MRVHGNNVLSRRSKIAEENNYEKYRDSLREDFCYICGYCGKSEIVTTKGFEIDHLTPDKIDPSRREDYNNLVYSCSTCNRKKGKKWPTGDKAILHNDMEGFIDPVDKEFDNHLGRNVDGEIIYLTDLGKYMHNIAFRFDIRPTSTVWKIMNILERKEKLREKRENGNLSSEQIKEYIAIDEQLVGLQKFLFNKGE